VPSVGKDTDENESETVRMRRTGPTTYRLEYGQEIEPPVPVNPWRWVGISGGNVFVQWNALVEVSSLDELRVWGKQVVAKKTAIPEAYLIVWDEGSTSGVISTPFSTAFDMSKTANDATTDNQMVSFAICRPETTGPISI